MKKINRHQSTAAAPERDRDVPVRRVGVSDQVQAKRAAAARKAATARTTADIAASGVESPAAPIPHGDRIVSSFGRYDIGAVQTQVGGPAGEACSQIGAEAYAKTASE